MYANVDALKRQDTDELLYDLSRHVNELNYCDFDDDFDDHVPYHLNHIRVIADILEDRVKNSNSDEV
jgi:hypothetical protein